MEKHVDNNINTEQFNFLSALIENFSVSKKAYENYINDGRIFLHAKVLKKANDSIRITLLNNHDLIPDDLLEDANELIEHYDIWINKWIKLEQKLHPNVKDEFVFQNKFTFPSNSEKKFVARFKEVKKNLE